MAADGTGVVESQILAALKMGFTTEDAARLSVPEVLAFADTAFPGEDGPRKATQADIDRLLG